jgi:K(+)-stimulated pyrophosphate-energized sodium pump
MSTVDQLLYNVFLYVTPILGVLGLVSAYLIYRQVVALPDGNDRMREIGTAIREGAFAYLGQQARVLAVIVAVIFVCIWLGLGIDSALAYVFGAVSSVIAGYCGMNAATMANVRTAHAASEKKPDEALMVAFNGGAVMGMAVASLGVLGLGLLYFLFGTPKGSETLIGFAVGASSVALFARVGGGIYTKAADVGADLVGKLEAGIPEDDPRNPGVIADNVGDNVGDVAGMGADIYETFVTSVIGCIALGATMGLMGLQVITDIGTENITDAKIYDYRLWLMITADYVGRIR